jgi:hypothetical protein
MLSQSNFDKKLAVNKSFAASSPFLIFNKKRKKHVYS